MSIKRHSLIENLEGVSTDAQGPQKGVTTKLLLWVCVIGNMIWFVDCFYPSGWENGVVLEKAKIESSNPYESAEETGGTIGWFSTDKGEVKLGTKELVLIKKGDHIRLKRTPINHVVTDVIVLKDGFDYKIESIYNIYFPFLFFPILSFLAAVLGLLSKMLKNKHSLLDFQLATLSIFLFLISVFVFAIT